MLSELRHVSVRKLMLASFLCISAFSEYRHPPSISVSVFSSVSVRLTITRSFSDVCSGLVFIYYVPFWLFKALALALVLWGHMCAKDSLSPAVWGIDKTNAPATARRRLSQSSVHSEGVEGAAAVSLSASISASSAALSARDAGVGPERIQPLCEDIHDEQGDSRIVVARLPGRTI